MSVPTNCVSCGMQLYTNPPMKDITCDKCDENEELKQELQQEKERAALYKQMLERIVQHTKYEGNQWYENVKKVLNQK